MPAQEPGEGPGSEPGDGPCFEARLERIEQIVDRLDQGELSLEESLSVFEEGVALSKQCWTELEAAEQRVEILVREGGAWSARPFDAVDDAADEDALVDPEED
ncbi:MAG: exodeoxyribonuclease VII small subunit [Deltaproteobacteria bacterium]|nr:exodeoxyribonuclease VII small subunit [Deltaproteobacteria bacterium]MBW2418567.1 exodeoxyribonuclease VII small subunit [Deltaproteobacteria bacterium]